MTDTPKLTYALRSDPDPVVVAGNGKPGTTKLTIVASNPTARLVTIASIAFQFPIGSNANDLSATTASGFTLTMPQGWGETTQGSTITFTPNAGSASVGPDGLVFTFELAVNATPGTAQITVTETDSTGSGTTALFVSKFPQTFSITPITASPPALAGPGQSTTLDWDVSVGTEGASCTVTLGYQTATAKGSKTVGLSGDYTTPAMDTATLFTLTVDGTDPQGNSFTSSSSVYVPVGPPLVTSFLASNGTQEVTVDYGAPAILVWTTQNATSVTLQPTGAPAYRLDTLNTEGFKVQPLTSTSYYLSADYAQDGAASDVSSRGGPVTVTVAPPKMLDVQIVSVAGGNFVNGSYQLTYAAENANYVLLTTAPDQDIAPAWYPVTQTTIDIPTPTTQGVVYQLQAFQLTEVQIDIISSGGTAAQVQAAANHDTPISAAMSATLTFEAPGLHVETYQFPADLDKQTYTFPTDPAASAFIVYIDSFFFEFQDGAPHYVSQLSAYIDKVTQASDGVTVSVHQFLSDQHDPNHKIGSNSFIGVTLIWLDKTVPPSLTMAAPSKDGTKVTLPASEVVDPVNGIYDFKWQGDQNKISGLDLSMGTPTVSGGNVVTTSGATFELDHSGKPFGKGSVLWDTLAQIKNQPGGIDIQTFKGLPIAPFGVTGSGPIQSVIAIPTGFHVGSGSSNNNLSNLSLTTYVSGAPGDPTFTIAPQMFWQTSSGQFQSGSVDYAFLIIYQVPD